MKRKVIRKLIAGLVMLSLMAILTTPALGINLWVVPENPTGYLDSNDDFVLDDVVIKDVYMGTSFSGNISIFYQQGPSDVEFAENVSIKFFVNDDENINNITIGTAQLIKSGSLELNQNTNSANKATLEFSSVENNPPVPKGYGVSYLVGDIPWSGGPSVTGNLDEGDFNPDNASYYVKVPFTINFEEIPEIGFALYAYAENHESDPDFAKTVYSHDGAIYHTPEFSTIALPIAAIIGIMFILQSRRRKEDWIILLFSLFFIAVF